MLKRPPLISIALISAGSLAYEILLMRLFSIVQWHHFAYMIIGLALLGYGVSGTVVSIAGERLLKRYKALYIGCLFLFGWSAVLCFLTAQQIPFNAEEIFWDPRQSFYLAALFLLLTIPFFFAATAICLTFMHFNDLISRIYAVDLLGAGMGSLSIVLMLYLFFPQTALLVVGIIGLAAAIIAGWELRFRFQNISLAITFTTIILLAFTGHAVTLNMSPYKSLQQTLLVDGTRVIQQRSSPLGLLSVVESSKIPLRYAPGLSLNATAEPPPQLGIFTDGDNMSVITQMPTQLKQLNYLDQLTSALPYHLKQLQRVLILGAGGGTDILQAKLHQPNHIDVVELNPQLMDLVGNTYRDFAGDLYGRDDITSHIGEARGYLSDSKQLYDLIQLALMDSFNASTSGLYALNESYLYTIEALQLYLKRLKTDGYLVITRWIKMPPRDTLKLFATAVEALSQSGSEIPEKQLLLIRGWQTSTLVIKNGTFNRQELTETAIFCNNRSFDIGYEPGMTINRANRYNILTHPVFYTATKALLSDQRQQFIDSYKFDLQPATDDRPYFHHFFKWAVLPEIIHLRGKGGMPLLEWGYVVFIATLVIAILMSVVLILLPLRYFRRLSDSHAAAIRRSHVLLYFFAIGLAFLFIEIAFMQKFILFLHHPIFAISVSISSFLVFAGLGSNWSNRFAGHRKSRRVLIITVIGITLIASLYLLILPLVFELLATAPMVVKILITLLLITPLAFLMGLPFPLAMSILAEHAAPLVPWAWGINGCASVISTVLATMLAIHFGFTVVILIAMLLYISIVFVFPQPSSVANRL